MCQEQQLCIEQKGGFTKNNSKALSGNVTIDSDNFLFNRETNVLNAKGNAKIEDKVEDYLIFSDDITYFKNVFIPTYYTQQSITY